MIPSPRLAPSTTGGKSSTVRIAFTPGIAAAARVSIRTTLACGIGLKSSLAKSIPSTR